MRRVFLHLGLHKTGVTAAQSFLFENRELIWPHYALVLPYKTRKTGLADAATRHSLYGTARTLADFGDQMRDFLEATNFGTKRGLILSEENFSGLRPSRNVAVGYEAAPDLAACLVDTIRNRFAGEELDITIYLSLRQRGSWLYSLWAHDLQRLRLVQDFETYRSHLDTLPSLRTAAEAIQERLPSIDVQTQWLEEMVDREYGPGSPFAEFLGLRLSKASQLIGPTRANPRLPENTLAQMLQLNRSGLDDTELVRQKAGLIQSAQNSLTATT
ncbi:hypothetical protein [Ruegeria arenilitoris]|uniref:hypothetical protein n=1 Tax=Ruegeria arenilitoris TaxID=1173585 RepID=UPI00147D49DC|nr:hypothetical protein [Ruegeria arenilitoris]